MSAKPSATIPAASLDELCINALRFLSVDAVQKANSGHPGLPLGAAAMAYVLWTRFLEHHPANPDWFDRDRFVLSLGHGSMLLYSLLHHSGYCLMIGGENAIVTHLDPIFKSIAPGVEAAPRTSGRKGAAGTAENGYLHCGPTGAGHFVKMVHNGIEYGLMANGTYLRFYA